MLSRKQRIPKAQAREVFMIGGVAASSPSFTLKVIKAAQSDTKFAVSVSKKVAPRAVLRNRTRRRVYSVLRDELPRVKSGFNAAFVARAGATKLHGESLVKEIVSLLSRADLLVR